MNTQNGHNTSTLRALAVIDLALGILGVSASIVLGGILTLYGIRVNDGSTLATTPTDPVAVIMFILLVIAVIGPPIALVIGSIKLFRGSTRAGLLLGCISLGVSAVLFVRLGFLVLPLAPVTLAIVHAICLRDIKHHKA